MGYQNPGAKGQCVGRPTEGSVEVGHTRAMFKVSFLYVSIGDLGEIPSSGSLMRLPVVSCGRSAIRDSRISCSTQGTLGISTSSIYDDGHIHDVVPNLLCHGYLNARKNSLAWPDHYFRAGALSLSV